MLRLIFVAILALAVGYWLGLNKPELFQSLKKHVADVELPLPKIEFKSDPEDYSDRDRKKLDSILNQVDQ